MVNDCAKYSGGFHLTRRSLFETIRLNMEQADPKTLGSLDGLSRMAADLGGLLAWLKMYVEDGADDPLSFTLTMPTIEDPQLNGKPLDF